MLYYPPLWKYGSVKWAYEEQPLSFAVIAAIRQHSLRLDFRWPILLLRILYLQHLISVFMFSRKDDIRFDI